MWRGLDPARTGTRRWCAPLRSAEPARKPSGQDGHVGDQEHPDKEDPQHGQRRAGDLALSRSFYGEPQRPYDVSGLAESGEAAGEIAALPIVFPFVLDVIARPVTSTRDLIVLD